GTDGVIARRGAAPPGNRGCAGRRPWQEGARLAPACILCSCEKTGNRRLPQRIRLRLCPSGSFAFPPPSQTSGIESALTRIAADGLQDRLFNRSSLSRCAAQGRLRGQIRPTGRAVVNGKDEPIPAVRAAMNDPL